MIIGYGERQNLFEGVTSYIADCEIEGQIYN
jgi:hypothetical protein